MAKTTSTKPFYNSTIPSDWEVKIFADIIHDFRGGAPLTPEDFTKTGYKVLPKSGVCHGGILLIENSKQQYCSTEYAKIHLSNTIDNTYIIVVLRDLVPSGPNIGLMVKYLTEDKFILAQGVYGFRLKDNLVDNDFLIQYSNGSQYRKLMKSIKVGSTQVHITNTEFFKIKFTFPPIPEQKAIANLLGLMDRAISKNNSLIAQKELQKKWLMQNLLTGKKRLKGFSDEWKEVKLGDIGKIKMCKRIFNHETKSEGDIPFYKIGTFGKIADAFIPKELYNEYRRRFSFPKKGEILISAAGTLGRTVVYDGSPAYFQDSNIVWISHDESKALNEYLFYVYKIIRYESEGGTIQRLYNSIISNGKFNLPSIEEQTAIAQVLQAADKEIHLLKTKSEKLKEKKKWLMQVLLTGKVRIKINN